MRRRRRALTAVVTLLMAGGALVGSVIGLGYIAADIVRKRL